MHDEVKGDAPQAGSTVPALAAGATAAQVKAITTATGSTRFVRCILVPKPFIGEVRGRKSYASPRAYKPLEGSNRYSAALAN